MVAFMFRMPSGIPGVVSRPEQSTIESIPYDPSAPFAGFGLFGKIVSGQLAPIGAGDTAASVYGLLTKPYPAGNTQEGLGVAVPPTSGMANTLRRGYATVVNNAGTPALNGQVYVRVAAPSGAKVIGGIEAASDSTNTIAITGCTFTNAGDANGNVEIAYNI